MLIWQPGHAGLVKNDGGEVSGRGIWVRWPSLNAAIRDLSCTRSRYGSITARPHVAMTNMKNILIYYRDI